MISDNNNTANKNYDDKARENRLLMTEAPVPRLILRLSCSTVISMLAGTVYNLADMYFVSRISNSAVAAVGVMFSVLSMIQAAGYTFGMGAGSRISRLLGKNENEKADLCATLAFVLSVISGLVLMATGFIWENRLVHFLGGTDTISDYAMEYGTFILITAPVMCGAYVLNNVLRSEGMPVWALAGIGTGCILNIILDPIFISLLDMGIRGAGLATLIGQTAGFVIMFLVLLSKKSVVNLKFEKKYLKDILPETKIIIKTGSPSFFRQGLVCMATIMINRAASAYGDDTVAAISVANKVFAIIFAATVGYGQGFSPVAGYNFGAKKYDRVKKSVKFAIVSETVAVAVIGLFMWIFAEQIMEIFGENEQVGLGVTALRSHAASLPFMSLSLITGMLFQATGKIKQAVLMSSARQGIFFLPLIWLLPAFFNETGIALTQGISDILAGLFAIPFLIVWNRKYENFEKH